MSSAFRFRIDDLALGNEEVISDDRKLLWNLAADPQSDCVLMVLNTLVFPSPSVGTTEGLPSDDTLESVGTYV